jgi:predicted RNA-binding protein YlxR (DUF448 family)
VAGPDNIIAPDLAAKLPGRGVWIKADRDTVEQAARRGAFARSLKADARAPAGLAELVQSLLEQRCLALLGFANRAGALAIGFTAVDQAIRARSRFALIEASDGEADGRERLLRLAYARWGREPELSAAFTSEQLGVALGRGRVIHIGLLQERMGQAWATELGRLSGFRPIVPNSWPPSWRMRHSGTDEAGGVSPSSPPALRPDTTRDETK